MLSLEEKEEIDRELKQYPDKSSGCIDALKVIQHHRGWISDEGINDIAGYLEMSPDQIDGVATFYNLIFRKPVGKHVILLCDSVSCWIKGCDNLKDALKSKLNIDFGETTRDNLFTLLPNQCLGVCDHAPCLMIDNELYRDVKPEQIEKIIDGIK